MENAIQLRDLRTAFAYKTNTELRFTWLMFAVMKYPVISKLVTALASATIKYHLPFKWLIRKTAFRVFCSGENTAEAFHTIKRLHNFQVRSVLDYVSEGEKNEKAYDATARKIITNIETIVEGTRTDFISLKITGLEDPDFLQTVNVSDISPYKMNTPRLQNLINRVDRICKAASDKNVMVYIDAEETWLQDIIDYLAEQMMCTYNIDRVVVFNTLQMYRCDRLDYLKRLLDISAKQHYMPGIKLVRGAYREKESRLALKEGKPNPVFDLKEDTDNAFNEATKLCLQHHNRVVTCVATHNEDSIKYALDLIETYGIRDYAEKVQFSQLFGMSDHLTFNLTAQGYHASKYLPYGEVEKAIPYLIRRAEENTSVNGQVGRELELLTMEMKRRDNYYA